MDDLVTLITVEEHNELIELIDDTISYFCQENMVSGETAYKVLECYSYAKQMQFAGEIV